jgi:hypothetical protein
VREREREREGEADLVGFRLDAAVTVGHFNIVYFLELCWRCLRASLKLQALRVRACVCVRACVRVFVSGVCWLCVSALVPLRG